MGHRPPRLRWWLAGQRQELADLLGAEGRGRPGPRRVGQLRADQLGQGRLVAPIGFGGRQARPGRQPAGPPELHGLPREAFNWYIDLRKYGTVPHGGFGMGIERCVAWICGLEHVRETIAFPRMLYRLRP